MDSKNNQRQLLDEEKIISKRNTTKKQKVNKYNSSKLNQTLI